MAGQALDFKSIIFTSLKENWIQIIIFLIPLIIFIISYKKVYYHLYVKELYKYALLFVALYILVLLSLNFDKKDTYSSYNLYFNTHAPTITVNKLGLLTEFRLDLNRYLFGFNSKIEVDDYTKEEIKEESENSDEKPKIEYNSLNLDFDFETSDNTIKNLNEYFSNKQATNKNDYTGIFEGKNLIYILAEGFNSIAVDKTLTPTLYKLVNSSFIFENYYSPVFMSTTGGEFQFTTSLIPTQESLNKWKENELYFPYAIGTVFNNLDYSVKAFHDWTYKYYKRNVTMKSLGFNSYIGCGNGLEKEMNCKIWPPSDIEMIDASIDDYINEDKFAVYYISVSGHAEYNFYGNNMANKNKTLVDDLKYSTPVKAYLATQIEFDRAIEELLNKLEEAGKLDDTVIVISGDHYPYTLSVDEINEVSTFKRDETFDVNKSNLIIYNSEIEPTKIDKLSSSVDVIPTLLNMFGVSYDSRLLIGSDIMSDHDSLVVFNDYSWITETGRYNIKTNTFTPSTEEKVGDDYVSTINKEVQNRVNVSTQVISSNYYKKLFDSQSKT